MKKLTLMFMCLLMSAWSAFAQTNITGTVISAEDGEPVIGASVAVKGTTTGTVTDLDGKFILSVEPGKILQVSYIGFSTSEVPAKQNMKITLSSATQDIEEVVVVGYGVQKKKDVTSSISVVKGDDLANLATPSFDSQLAGRAAGVQVIQPSSILGAVPIFRIRGVNSLSSGKDPLIVVDGMPITSGDMSNNVYVYQNSLADINPNDIQSIDILKDGAATAIYGSRAANGVVLITTKKGAKGSAKLTYDGYVGFAQASKLHNLLDGKQFTEIANEKWSNWGDEGLAVYDGTNTNWNDYIYRTGFQQNHSLGLSGGTAKSQYFFSLGYTSQEGIVRSNNLERYSLKADLTHEANKWLKVGVSTLTSKSRLNGISEGGNSLADASFGGIRMLPNVAVFNPEDPTGYNIDPSNRGALGRGSNKQTIENGVPNTVWVLDNNVNRSSSLRSISNVFAEITFLPGFKFRTQGGWDLSMIDNYMVWGPQSGDGYGRGGLLESTATSSSTWNWQNMFTYDKTFNGLHNLGLTALQEYTRFDLKYTDASVQNLSDPFFTDHIISGTYATQNVYGGKVFSGLASYMFRANYNYDSKYYIGASVRTDGLSRLSKDNRWGVFWGGSLAWRISREKFWTEGAINDVVNDFRIRGSYATVGNQNIKGYFPYMGAYMADPYGNQSAIYWSNMANPNLKWETTETYDLGFDASLFQSRMTVEFAYWRKNTKDLVLNVPTAPSMGIPDNQFTQNIGALMNDGFEITLGGTIITNKDFKWQSSLNFSTMNNKITSLVDHKDIIGDYTIIREGESMNNIYGFDYVGVNKANGNPIWQKADGSLTQFDSSEYGWYVEYDPKNPTDVTKESSLDDSDRKLLGSSIPSWFGGWNNTFTYKGFDATVFFRFSGGNKIMNATRQDLLNMGFANNGTEILGRWQSPENPGNGMVPKIYSGTGPYLNNENRSDSRFVEDGSFLKLSTLSIGYTLPDAFVKKLNISKLRFFVQGQNLFTLTGYSGLDPELVSDLTQKSATSFVGGFGVDWNAKAQQRAFTFGANITF